MYHEWRGKRNKSAGYHWVCFDVEKWYGGEDDEVLATSSGKKTAWTEYWGKMEGEWRRGRPAETGFKDFKEWIKPDMAYASQLWVTDRRQRVVNQF